MFRISRKAKFGVAAAPEDDDDKNRDDEEKLERFALDIKDTMASGSKALLELRSEAKTHTSSCWTSQFEQRIICELRNHRLAFRSFLRDLSHDLRGHGHRIGCCGTSSKKSMW